MTGRGRAALAAGLGTAAATGVAVVAARHAVPSEVSPVTPSGDWNAAWIAGAVSALALASLGWALARHSPLRLRTALALAVVIQALPLAAPLLLSKDAYLYWIEARILVVHHADPYSTTPSRYPHDPAYPYVSQSWLHLKAPYGPAWEILATAPAAAARSSPHDAELAYRALALVGMLVLLAGVAVRTRSAASVALLGWNPLLALHFAGGGHGDVWMMVPVVLAAGAQRPGGRAGGAWAVAASFKPVPLVLLPLELARLRFRPPSRSFWAGLLGAGLAILATSTAAFGTKWARETVSGAHQASGLGGVHWLGQAGLTHREAVVAAGLVFLAVYAVLFADAWRRSRARLSLAATALCLTSSLLRPWYALWPAALAAVEEDALAGLAASALTAYLLLGDAVRL